MADNTQESTRPIAKLPTRLIVNTDTGAADLYVDEGIFGRTLVATGSAVGNNWTVNDAFVKKYNTRNGTNLTQSQLQQTFAKDYQKDLNNDRAAIVNKYSPYNTKKYLQETAKIPGVINPQTKTKTGDTTSTPTTATKEEETGDNSQPASQTEPPAPDKTRNDFPKNLIYPSDIGQSKQDIIKFNMVKYEPKKFSGVGFAARRSVSSENIIGSVILPVPGGITDTNAVSWGSDNLDPLQVALAQAALGFTSGGVEGATAAAESIGAGVAAGREDIKTAIAAAFAGQVAGVRSLITRTTGAIINPNMELLFQAPTLRPFNFTFKLSPRNSDEAKEVIRIIRFFKQGMSPITTPSNLFLKSPHTFKIQYKLRNDKEHPYIGKIKECALTGFTVDYTPDGNYATFEDGVMTSYQISMTFQELEPVFNSDYTELDNNEDTEIGY